MSDYLLIESRDPFEGNCKYYQTVAENLVKTGQKVALYLIENGVLPTRHCRHSSSLTELASLGVEVLADEFSLRERGIDKKELVTGVSVAPLDTVIDMMAIGRKVIWR